MIVVGVEAGFDDWRRRARELAARRVHPDHVAWTDAAAGASLFDDDPPSSPDSADPTGPAEADRAPDGDPSDADSPTKLHVPERFVERAQIVACHRDESRWDLLYRVLWRLSVEGDRGLLEDAADPDVRRFDVFHKQVRFDAHKAKAFIRFRRVASSDRSSPDSTPDSAARSTPDDRFVAWHRPQHRVLSLVAPFFARRFGVMRWTIFTPLESADWDGRRLALGPGVEADPLQQRDELEQLWRTYYASIFNPARIKVGAMLREMPRRYWATMPETSIVDELLRDAPHRVKEMMAKQRDDATAEPFLPPEGHRSLPQLASAARLCEGCELHENATQTVFGRGPADARLMLVGEQPGDEEDTTGEPFVGPAGKLLDDALAAADIDRSTVYVTNTVKHFRNVPRGKRRLHQKPTVEHVRACLPWLREEIERIQPRVVLALGATAGQALLGRTFRVTKQRGELLRSDLFNTDVLGTIHPSAILRMPDPETRRQAFDDFVRDLGSARDAADRAG